MLTKCSVGSRQATTHERLWVMLGLANSYMNKEMWFEPWYIRDFTPASNVIQPISKHANNSFCFPADKFHHTSDNKVCWSNKSLAENAVYDPIQSLQHQCSRPHVTSHGQFTLYGRTWPCWQAWHDPHQMAQNTQDNNALSLTQWLSLTLGRGNIATVTSTWAPTLTLPYSKPLLCFLH